MAAYKLDRFCSINSSATAFSRTSTGIEYDLCCTYLAISTSTYMPLLIYKYRRTCRKCNTNALQISLDLVCMRPLRSVKCGCIGLSNLERPNPDFPVACVCDHTLRLRPRVLLLSEPLQKSMSTYMGRAAFHRSISSPSCQAHVGKLSSPPCS